jgi:hypothetical protein
VALFGLAVAIHPVTAGAQILPAGPGSNPAQNQPESGSDSAPEPEFPEDLPEIFRYIELGDYTAIKHYFVQDGDPDIRRPSDGWTPLHVAVEKNDVTLAGMLLRYDADPNLRARDIYQDPVLHYAINKKENLDMIALLLQAGADPDALSGNKQNTALMRAVTAERLEVVRLLLSAGADITAKNLDGADAVTRARHVKNRQLHELIETRWRTLRDQAQTRRKPMKLNRYEVELFEALDAAKASDALEMAHNPGVNPNARSANNVTLLMLAAYRGMTGVARALLDRGANVHGGKDPPVLFFGLKPTNAAEMTKLLLAYGADPNARRARDDRPALTQAILNDQFQAAHILLQQGARPDYADAAGLLPRDFAAKKPDPGRWLELLQTYSAPGELLPVAAASPRNRAEAASNALSSSAADPALYRDRGIEPNRHRLELHLAVARSDYSTLQTLLEDGADVLSYNSRGRTALMSAAEMADAHMVRLLLQAGAEPNQVSRDDYKTTAIIYAASRKNSLPVIQLLHENGAGLNVGMGEVGYTPLMLTAALGQLDAVRYLLARGADPRIRARDGFDARSFAQRGGNLEILKLLNAATQAR